MKIWGCVITSYSIHYTKLYDEYLILDNGGHILEGTGSNFYGIKDGVVYTAGKGVLDGITRKVILSLLPDLKIPLRLQAT